MRKILPTFIRKFIAIFMALNFLNNCVDSVDPISHRMIEDLSYNDIESVFELFAEVVLSIDNVCIEIEDNDCQDDDTNVKDKYDSTRLKFDNVDALFISSVEKCIDKIFDQYTQQYHPEITPPPPKA